MASLSGATSRSSAAQHAGGGEQDHRHQLAVEHRGDGDQHAGQQSGDVAAEHAHHQAAFESQIDGLIGAAGDHARGDSGSENRSADQRHLDAVHQRALFAHQHRSEARAARQHARERRRDGQLHHQDHQVLLEHVRSWALAIIIME